MDKTVGRALAAGAAVLGVSEAVFRFLICFLASLPFSAGLLYVPGVVPRHVYAASVGVVLVHLSFGTIGTVYVVLPVLFSYAVMGLSRKYCGRVTFLGAFGFLIYSHVSLMSGDHWKDGGMDFTGALMVMTLKVISCAMNYQDGIWMQGGKVDPKLMDSHARNALTMMPSFLEFLSYTYCCGNVLVGPVYEMKDYLAYIERREIWAAAEAGGGHRLPSPYLPAAKSFSRAIFCLLVYVWLAPLTAFSKLSDLALLRGPALRKWGFFYLVGFAARWKYYFIWALSETACCLSGFGFSGWEESSSSSSSGKDGPQKKKRAAVWTRAKNVDIIAVETGRGGAAALPKHWNITVSNWLREYVYLRLVPKGKKGGFWPLLVTQIVSGVWHGLYLGYIIFFANTAIMIAGSRVIHRWERAVSPRRWALRLALATVQSVYCLSTLGYAVFGFLLLSLEETLRLFGEMYYFGTVIPVVLILIGMVTPSSSSLSSPSPKRTKDGVDKEE